MKRMPIDLIARSLSDSSRGAEDGKVVLETYDFGGQEVYYAMHHLFLTDCGLYLACIDLSTIQASAAFVASAHEQDVLADENSAASAQTWDALEWWLASISINAPTSPVAIVGTHDDCLDTESRERVHQTVHGRIVALCTRQPELNSHLWVNEERQLCFFPLDNSGRDGGVSLTSLRRAVDGMALRLLEGPPGQPVPLRWQHFWAVLQRTEERLGPLCRRDELWRRSARYGFESMAELLRFLEHFRSLGLLLYFPESSSEELSDLVCLDPAWVAEAAAHIMQAKDRVLQGCARFSSELRERGMLHEELLSRIWRQGFARHQRQLLELLQALDLLMPWQHEKGTAAALPSAAPHQVFLVPALLPPKPPRSAGEPACAAEDDSIVIYLDFHGLLHRLLPTMFPRMLCTLSRTEAAAQILSVHSNYALFAFSSQGQARGDSARSLGGRRQVQKLLVSLQPCGGGELLRCCIRPRRVGAGADARVSERPSWRQTDRLLHAFRDALAAWMPHVGFRAGVRCPVCCHQPHSVDLHAILSDEMPLCPRSLEPLEELPLWLESWRAHLRPHSSLPPETLTVEATTSCEMGVPMATPQSGIHLEYLYASPLDACALDIRAEMEVLVSLPGLSELNIRTATTETLVEVCRSVRGITCGSSVGPQGGLPRVLCLSAHCAADPLTSTGRQPCLLLEDSVGCGHRVAAEDLGHLLGAVGVAFDAVMINACHSEHAAPLFIAAGAKYVVACAGKVFDAAARVFLRSFLTTLATEGGGVPAAFAAAQRSVRLSPQPGLRSEADRFRLHAGNDLMSSSDAEDILQSTPRTSAPLPLLQVEQSPTLRMRPWLLQPVEDFIGRSSIMASIASHLNGHRRAVWLHGPRGRGKSALATEICRFYGLPGDRIFSPMIPAGDNQSKHKGSMLGGAILVRLGGLEPDEAIARVQRALGGDNVLTSASNVDSKMGGRRWLLVLDGVDALVGEQPSTASTCDSFTDFHSTLEKLLQETERLRLLLTSRRPLYTMQLPCKIVFEELSSLAPEDAALLMLRRAHRPLYPRDFDASNTNDSGASGAWGDPVHLHGRRQQLLQQLAAHKLFEVVGHAPGDVADAASAITNELPSLFRHPALLSHIAAAG